jgi:hypothetical protein
LISNESPVTINRWKKYYMRKETKQETNEVEEMSNENECRNIGESKDKLEKLKIDRSPGPVNIIAELFKIKQNVFYIYVFDI